MQLKWYLNPGILRLYLARPEGRTRSQSHNKKTEKHFWVCFLEPTQKKNQRQLPLKVMSLHGPSAVRGERTLFRFGFPFNLSFIIAGIPRFYSAQLGLALDLTA